MEIAGKLMEKGIDFRSHHRQQLLQKNIHPEPDSGQSSVGEHDLFDGRCIFSAIRQSEMEFYGVDSKDMDGIIDQLRLTEGVEACYFPL